MSVVIETTLGDVTVDLFIAERPTACLNFLKLCKLKYYNYNLFHTISRGFIAQTGDPTGSRTGGDSIFGILNGHKQRYFQGENKPRIKHTKMGLISFVGNDNLMLGSQFFITLGEDLTYLDDKHCVFGEVVEGFDVLEIINEVICDGDDRPYQDVRITHTVILDDPIPNPEGLRLPSRSPSPSAERLMGGRIAPDEEIDEMEGKSASEVAEVQADREAKARATILEMVGDIPDAEMAPPENVLFVCKLNPVTTDEDLEIIFNRFGKIKSCEVIRDKKTGDSLQYAFIEFDDRKACEDAYFKMDNILIDDRRIHVDFSQSVSKIKWHGKGRGVTHYDERGKKVENLEEKSRKKNTSEYNPKINEIKSLNNEDIKKKYFDNEDRSRKDNGSRDSKSNYYQKHENYAHETKNRPRYDRRISDKYSKSHSSAERSRYYEIGSYKRKNEEMKSKRNNEKYHSSENISKQRKANSSDNEERILSTDSYKKNVRKRYSSESSDNYHDKKSSKKIQIKERENKHLKKKEKHDSKHKSALDKKKKKRDSSTSSSESTDREKYQKEKSKLSKKRDSSSSDSSSDDITYKKKKKRSSSDSDAVKISKKKYKEKERKKQKKKRKSSDSSDSEKDRKRKK